MPVPVCEPFTVRGIVTSRRRGRAAPRRGRLPLAAVLAVVAGLVLPAGAAATSTPGPPAYVGRVAALKSTSTATTATLSTSRAVNPGDSLVVSVMLLSTDVKTLGQVTVTDGKNVYGVDADQNDATSSRLLVLSSAGVASLASGSTITVSFPSASSVFVTVDEFSGVVGRDGSASSRSGPGGTWSSGPVTPSAAGDLLYGVVGTQSGNATWASGWTTLTTVSGGGKRLGPGYQVPSGTGPFTATGSSNGAWLAAMVAFTAAPPPPDSAPVAALTVTPTSGPAPLMVTADASRSTDSGDATPISTYRFDFGDGTAAVTQTVSGTTNAAVATHSYQAAGPYTVTVTVTDTGGLSSTATSAVTVDAPTTSGGGTYAVYAGYYDTHHPSFPQPKPSPWSGSSGVVFMAKSDTTSGGWDSSAVRVANLTSSTLANVTVTVDIGSHRFALWSAATIPAGSSLIVAQTSKENFDGSDSNTAGCFGCDPSLCMTSVLSTIPVVHVSVGGVTTNFSDTKQILNTRGVDSAGCPDTGGTRNDESEVWQQIGSG